MKITTTNLLSSLLQLGQLSYCIIGISIKFYISKVRFCNEKYSLLPIISFLIKYVRELWKDFRDFLITKLWLLKPSSVKPRPLPHPNGEQNKSDLFILTAENRFYLPFLESPNSENLKFSLFTTSRSTFLIYKIGNNVYSFYLCVYWKVL